MKFTTPILFMTFNRLDTVKKVFTEIRKAKPQNLFLASDGPRTAKPGEVEKVLEVRRYLDSQIDWDCSVQRLYREENLGCKNAVSGAISWFFGQVEAGIILEDDCIPDPSFFPYCEELLERYKADPKVMMISGNQFLTALKQPESYYFTKFAHIWGWASWSRAWSLYDINLAGWPENHFAIKANSGLPAYAFLDFKRYFFKVKQNELNTWDFQWVYTIWANQGLSVAPKSNLISNIGFDENATHTLHGNSPLDENSVLSLKFPMVHPKDIVQSRQIDASEASKLFIHTGLLTRIKSKLSKLLKKS